MIPRTKVNYRLSDLGRAWTVSERSQSRRHTLVQHLSGLLEIPHILLTASGRGALYILLSCLPHGRVVVPAYTCKAVIEAIHLAGKKAVFAETEEDGFNMSPKSVAGLLNADTILLATHQFGIPCDISALLHEARKAGAFVIEDVAAALGTRVNGRMVGTFGDAAFFSFDTTKLVNVPLKGGFIAVRDPELYARCEAFIASNTRPMPLRRKGLYLLLGTLLILLENHIVYRFFHNIKFRWRGRFTDDSPTLEARLGPFYTDRLAEWQADILLPQIQRLWELVENRQRLYAEYLRELKGAMSFSLPPEDALREWAPIRFPIRVKGNKLDFYHRSVEYGVDHAFSFTYIACPVDFALSHRLASEVLDIPFYDRLTVDETRRVVNVLKRIDAAMLKEEPCLTVSAT